MYKFTPEQRAAMNASRDEIFEKSHYNQLRSKETPAETPAPVVPLKKEMPITKSVATMTAETEVITEQSVKVEPEIVVLNTITATETTPEPTITTQETSIMNVPPNLPKTVAGLIGNTYSSVKVISYNNTESLIPRGKKQMPLPHVNCHCLKCDKDFVVNAYRVSAGSQKSCGCDSKRKLKPVE